MRGRPGWNSEVGLELNKAQEVERSEKEQGQHYDLWFLTCEPVDKGKKNMVAKQLYRNPKIGTDP